jgi:uncharacterized membrane protein YczE
LKYLSKLGIVLVGFAFIALGLAAMYQSSFGMGPWGAFEIAVAGYTGLSIGRIIQIVNLALIMLAWLFKERPTLVTFLHMVMVGQFMDWILPMLPKASDLICQVLMFLLGMVFFAYGTSLYLQNNQGAGPRDSLMLGMANLLRISIRAARMGVEVLVLLLAVVMGGPIGIGTVFYAIGIGPLIQFFLKWRFFKP